MGILLRCDIRLGWEIRRWRLENDEDMWSYGNFNESASSESGMSYDKVNV